MKYSVYDDERLTTRYGPRFLRALDLKVKMWQAEIERMYHEKST